jgi:ABC-type Zn uptake system ZnuABC Zn-binding protein ZnuA
MSRVLRGLSALVPIAALVILAAACDDDGDEDTAEPQVKAVTTLELFADLVRNVGGDRVEVTSLLPPGADPHTYELPPDRVAGIVQADVIFMNGLGLEESIESVVSENAGGPIVELAEGLEVLPGGEDEHGDEGAEEEEEHEEDEADEEEEHEGEEEDEHAEGNPHLWLDVTNASRYVETIRDALIDADAEGHETYTENAEAYLEELAALDEEVGAAVASIPEENRKLVTFHDAFPYLANRYGLVVVGVAVPSPGQEPSARDIADLTETLRAENVPAVFKEPQFDAAVLEAAADDAGVRVLDLLSDAFTDDVQSYIELMRFNIQQLQEGLAGN